MNEQVNQEDEGMGRDEQQDQCRATLGHLPVVLVGDEDVGVCGMIWQHPGFVMNVYYVTGYRFFSVNPGEQH